MKVTIGTLNKAKIAIVTRVVASFVGDKAFDVEGRDIASGVPDTPYDEQTKTGAYNRALGASQGANVTYGIGIESGLIQRYGLWFEEAWACVIHAGKTYYGYSSGLSLPEYVLKRMAEIGEHGPTMRQIIDELNITDSRDTWGTYSGEMILRDVSLEEALRNALIQIHAPKSSLYHL